MSRSAGGLGLLRDGRALRDGVAGCWELMESFGGLLIDLGGREVELGELFLMASPMGLRIGLVGFVIVEGLLDGSEVLGLFG